MTSWMCCLRHLSLGVLLHYSRFPLTVELWEIKSLMQRQNWHIVMVRTVRWCQLTFPDMTNALLPSSMLTFMTRLSGDPNHWHKCLHRLDAGLYFWLPLKLQRDQETLLRTLQLSVAFTQLYLQKNVWEQNPDCCLFYIAEAIHHIVCT